MTHLPNYTQNLILQNKYFPKGSWGTNLKGKNRIKPWKDYLVLKSIHNYHSTCALDQKLTLTSQPFEKKGFLERTDLVYVVYFYQVLFHTVAFLSRYLTPEYTSNSHWKNDLVNVLNDAIAEALSLCVTVYSLLQWKQIHLIAPGAKKLNIKIETTQNMQKLMKVTSSKDLGNAVLAISIWICNFSPLKICIYSEKQNCKPRIKPLM